MTNLSIVIPVFNEEKNIPPLITRIHETLTKQAISYEVIFVDDYSTDNTRYVCQQLSLNYPIKLFQNQKKQGKASSLLEGFSHASYDLICIIDADLQYAPEEIPKMVEKIANGADIVIGNRKSTQENKKFRKKFHEVFFGNVLHHFTCDVQSGLKIFKKEIIERLKLNPRPWSFDLTFLIKARNGGYRIESVDISYAPRFLGVQKTNSFKPFSDIASTSVKLKCLRSEIIPFHPDVAQKKGNGFHYKGEEFIHHSDLYHEDSAFHRLSGLQMFAMVDLTSLSFLGFFFNWHTTLVILISFLTVLYFADLLFNLFLIYRSFSKTPEIQITDEELTNIPDETLPSYTVLCPLYKEWHVLAQFITAISHLEYPKDKLQVMLLLEEDDKQTISHISSYTLPSYFQIVIVPDSKPKTKPKALNFGLKHTKGEYIVIYDAEDIPDPLQLKKAVIAFQKAGKRTVCVQAKLNFYNPHQNLLTRVFTAEYSLWFELVLTGLQSVHAPIPLGGTSNHFKTADLKNLKGWDSFNVTEDCDLGMRLVKRGYQTAVIDSTTLEEANSNLKNWFGQRTRWIKGYMQTYLLHMRNPSLFFQNWKEPHAITFQLVVGGKVLSMFINPLMWVITISYFLFRAKIGTFIESFFPTPILYMGVTSLILGNFLYMYYYMIGCAKHGHDELVKYVILIPFYWLLLSLAAWTAVLKIITEPHYWSKTKHGLHLKDQKVMAHATHKIGKELVDNTLTSYPSLTTERAVVRA